MLTRILLGCLCFGAPALAVEWPGIPAEVWALKATGAPGERGAVILERTIRYGAKDTEVTARIRVFNEDGLGAVAMPLLDKDGILEGRTVLPDGTITPFNTVKDLVASSARLGRWEATAKTFVPPGLTSDCVVDLHYVLGTELKYTWVEIPVLETYPARKKTMEMATNSGLAFIHILPRDLQVQIDEKLRYRVYTFTDLPAQEQECYAVPDDLTPRFIYYSMPIRLNRGSGTGVDGYWREMAERIYKPAFTRALVLGQRYEDWSRALRSGLTGDSVAQATEIYFRLGERIMNVNALTRLESAALTAKEADEEIQSQDLETSVKRGRTNAPGMQYLFFQLLADQGLEPKILLAADRTQRTLQYDCPSYHQFTTSLIGVRTVSGSLVWFHPQWRFHPPGVINPRVQGTEGLLLDSKDWSIKRYQLEVEPASKNVSKYEFELAFGETETIAMKASFTGFSQYDARLDYCFLDPTEGERKLKEDVGKRTRELTIAKASIDHASETRKPFGLTLEGRQAFEGGRRRMVEPFPGLDAPLLLPASWPRRRNHPIFLFHRRRFIAVSRIHVPDGWVLGDEPEFKGDNLFGTVTWRMAELPGHQVEVTFEVQVDTAYAGHEAIGPFKQFLGWVDSAYHRRLTLERP